MNYVDGFVTPVLSANREAYRKHAESVASLFREHGATSVVECWGDDVPEGKVTSFPMAVKCEPSETVVFSWITGRRVRCATIDGRRSWPTRACSPAPNRCRLTASD